MIKYDKNPNELLQQFYILIDEINTIIDSIKSNFNKINHEETCKKYIENNKATLYSIYIK